jgi:hypothetical protein
MSFSAEEETFGYIIIIPIKLNLLKIKQVLIKVNYKKVG